MPQRNTKLTQQEFLDKVSKFDKAKNIKFLSEYKSRKERIDCLCLTCGRKWSPRADQLLRGRGCIECSRKNMSVSQSQSHEEFVEKLTKSNDNVILLEKYTNSHTKILCKCKKCGNEWSVIPPSLLSGHGCPKCGIEIMKSKTTKTHEQFIEDFKKSGNQYIEIVGKYINSSTKIKVRCTRCDKEYYSSPTKLLCGRGCIDCYKKFNFGENSTRWNKNKTNEERLVERKYSEYYQFINDVFKRDNYICQITNQKGGALVVHHLDGYGWCKDKRTDIDNGITITKNIHIEFHKMYGYGNNTKAQFLEFVEFLYKNNRIKHENYNLLLNKLR